MLASRGLSLGSILSVAGVTGLMNDNNRSEASADSEGESFNDEDDVLDDLGCNDSLDGTNSLDGDSRLLAGPQKRARKASEVSRQRNEEKMRLLLQQQSDNGGAMLSTAGRRSRRLRPIDGNKELVVLFPHDDPISKLQLESNEIAEFVCCMEEKFDWVPEADTDADLGHGKGYGGQAYHSDSDRLGGLRDPSFPRNTHSGLSSHKAMQDVKVPESRVNDSYYSNLPHLPPFELPPMGTVASGSHYASYDLDSEDEDFMDVWNNGKPLKLISATFDTGVREGKRRTAAHPLGAGAHVPLDERAFAEILMALERDYELNKVHMESVRGIDEAAERCDEYIDSCESIVEVGDGFDGGTHDINAVEKALALHEKRVDLHHIKLERSSSTNSVFSSKSAKSDTDPASDGPGGGKRGHNRHADLVELPIVTRAELENLVPREHAVRLLTCVYRSLPVFKDHFGDKPAEALFGTDSSDENKHVSAAMAILHEYWIIKRSSRQSSLLRCYHSFIMENWRHQDVHPMLSEDGDPEALMHAHSSLVKLRHDLDRARLIMDRLRRREKVKRELVRVAGDTTDDYLHSLPLAEKDERHGKAVGSRAKMKGVADIARSDRQPRAAKAAAIEKLESTPSYTTAAARSGDGETQHDGCDDYNFLIRFTLEKPDYDSLDTPSQLPNYTATAPSNEQSPKQEPGASNQGYYSDYDPRRGAQRNLSQYGSVSSQGHSNAATGWTADEDRLLLMGVAACGVGRWTEIREDFLLARNSAQMNQRFTRLARRRCVLVKINAASSKKGNSGENMPEYTEVRTAFMAPQDVSHARSKLPPLIVEMLESFSEDSVWESIALRHLIDMQSKDKRCGRPQKYPLPIPIPKHLQNGGFMSRKKLIIQRPSELGYNWKGAASSGDNYDYGNGLGSYSRGSYSQGPSNASSPSSSKKRSRSLPKNGESKQKRLRGDGEEGCNDADEISLSSELSSASASDEWKKATQEKERRVEEQNLSREARARIREKKQARFNLELDKDSEESSGEGTIGSNDSDKPRSKTARCSLNSLQVPSKAKGGRGHAVKKLSSSRK